MSEVLVGLDIGTTNIKALAINLAGELLGQASRRTPVHQTTPGSGHHDPEEMWAGVCETLRELTSQILPDHKPLGLAIASMGEAGVPLDKDGKVLYPFIIWHDVRTQPQCDKMQEEFGAREAYLRTGLPFNPMWSIMKLKWLAENEPQVFSAMRKWLCVEDFTIWRLTGEFAVSQPIACRTMAFNITKRHWDKEILSYVGVSDALFAKPYPSGTAIGKINLVAAEATGLPAGLPVATAGHDHLCASLAAGAVAPGFALDSCGTTETLIMTLDAPQFDERMIEVGYPQGCHVIEDKYVLYSGIRAGAVTLEWLAGILGIDVADLVAEAEKSSPGANGVYFLPHLRGGGTSNIDARSSALFYGLRDHNNRADFARAALEGICYEIASKLDFVRDIVDLKLGQLRTVGGGARAKLWNQLKADITGLPVAVPKTREATASGAALLAGIAVGAINSWHEASRLIPTEEPFLPDKGCYAEYHKRLDTTYRLLYPAVRQLSADN